MIRIAYRFLDKELPAVRLAVGPTLRILLSLSLLGSAIDGNSAGTPTNENSLFGYYSQ